jgi:hypothetical protein
MQRHDAHLSTLLDLQCFLIGMACSRSGRRGGRAGKRHDLALWNRPWCSLADLFRRDGAGADQPQHCHPACIEPPRRLLERQLSAFGHLPRSMRRHAMVLAEAAHPAFGPGIAAAGSLAEAVQRGGDGAVPCCLASARTMSHTSSSLLHRCRPLRLRGAARRMWSPPCQWIRRSIRSSASVTTISAMTARRIRLRVSTVAPGCNQAASRIGAERHQPVLLGRGQRIGSVGRHRRDPLFLATDLLQSVVPAALEFAGDKADRPRRTGGAPGPPRSAPRQAPAPPAARLGILPFPHRDRCDRGLHAERVEKPQDLGRHRRIHAQTAEGDAGSRPVVDVRTAAAVADAAGPRRS